MWWHDASCRDYPYPDIFVTPETAKRQISQAKAICERCPVRLQCYEEALKTDSFGVFAGFTHSERQKISSMLPSQFTGVTIGAVNSFQSHL